MFVCIVPSLTTASGEFSQIDPTHWLLEVPLGASSAIKEVVVSLLTPDSLDPETGASVYISRAGSGLWQYLGFLTNEKPSDVFRVPKDEEVEAELQSMAQGFQEFGEIPTEFAQLGVAIEPLDNIANMEYQGRSLSLLAKQQDLDLAMGIAGDLENFVTSVARPVPLEMGLGDALIIPSAIFYQWSERFRRRYAMDPHFWKKTI
jgi:hypothetical protein